MNLPTLLLAVSALTLYSAAHAVAADSRSVVYPREASAAEQLAAKELRRYVYLRTGHLLSLVSSDAAVPDSAVVIVGGKNSPAVRAAAKTAGIESPLVALKAQQYLLKTVPSENRRMVIVAGGDDAGVLYGAYRLAEHLGVRFYLHGDVIPDERIPLELPAIDETGTPLFELRGIQPFHDFPEGPDWWNLDDYKAILSQLPKLGMNFFGLHTYPQSAAGPEPTVWIGPAEEIAADGTVQASYRSRHFTTVNGTWGYRPTPSGQYTHGAAVMFEHDAYGAKIMIGRTPWPATPEQCNAVFNDFAAVLREAFEHAHALGIKTCVGTETPLIIPKTVQERLKAAGRDPADPKTIQAMYEGMFRWLARAYPIDYYWFWTPENWTWSGTTDEQVQQTLDDLRLAIAAAQAVDAPFTLATCGWVLGPPQDRTLFDNVFPKNMPMSCINRQVGKDPVEPGFAKVKGRPTWAIPWLEDDPALTSPQLWVGRMRRDAYDALRYGCNGLMGIHWRTRILGPNVSALAKAAWTQAPWNERAGEMVDPPCSEGAVGGAVAAYLQNPIADTDDDVLYQTVRYNMSAYRIAVPDGEYTVTLKFCEPHYAEKGKRAFGVRVQGKQVLDRLDVFAEAGQNRALDYTYKDVEVTGGRLDIDFIHQTEFPCIAAIVAEGKEVIRKINCGGAAHDDFQADLSDCPTAPRDLPAADFFADWAASQFGPDAGPRVAAIFDRIDGKHPQPSTWVHGPGGIQPDGRPWEAVSKEYAFVEELAALRPLVKGAGHRDRFDYWLNSFRYMRAIARVNCTWARYNAAMKQVDTQADAAAKARVAREDALPLRKELVAAVDEVYRYLLPTVSNYGEMGTVTNWEQHILPVLLHEPGEALAKVLGEPLPPDAVPTKTYDGPLHLIVPTVRGSLTAGEPLRLKAIILSAQPARRVSLLWRPLGSGEFRTVSLTHVSRGVWSAELAPDAIGETDFEYHVEAVPAEGPAVRFPATAPDLNQTVVVVSK